jgi:hypothetical protein
MMANESRDRPERRALSDESVTALRAAVLQHSREPGASQAELKRALERVAAEARQRQMLPEELIIAFKAVWESLPEVQGTGSGADELRLRERLITMVIKAYYEE